MSQLTAMPERPQVARHSGHAKRWKVLGVFVLGVLAVLASLFALKWPFTRKGITRRLERASSLQVEIRSLRSTYFPPGCIAEDVVFRKPGGHEPEPLIAVHYLRIESSYAGLLATPKRIQRTAVSGVRIYLPRGGVAIGSQKGSKDEPLLIQEFLAQNAVLAIAGKKAGAGPFSLLIHDARFQNIAGGRTIPFTVALHLPLPPGELQARGWIGPWAAGGGSVRSTPVSGSVAYQHGDLGVFKSIAGVVDGLVNFSGNLQRLEISGNTHCPDFEVRESGHRFKLSTEFRGNVDLASGDVLLPSLRAKLGETNLTASARIGGSPKTVEFNVTEGQGRLQDLILLFSDAPRSPMTGPIRFRTNVVLPAEHSPFEQRVRLRGAFDIEPAQFTAKDTKTHVDELSQRARGEKDKDPADADQVLSKLSGRVVLEKGVANFQQISFSVPGAIADMHGTYDLLNKQVDLRGTMRMQATVSQATKGVKSFFLKILDPFYKKKGAGADIPVSLTGRYGHTHFAAGLKK